MLNFDLMELYANTCAKYGPDSEQIKLIREAHKDDIEFTKFAYGYDMVKRAVGGSGINWVPRFDMPNGVTPDNPTGCPNPEHHTNVYFDKVNNHQAFRVFGQVLMILSFIAFVISAFTLTVTFMLCGIMGFMVGAVMFTCALIPLHVGDVLYLRKKAEREQGIY